MANPFLSANSDFGLAAEGTRGTAASISSFTPITEPKVSPKLTWLKDAALRGSPVALYDNVPGVRHDEFTGKVFIYHDVFPNMLRAALGSTDSVASVSSSSSTHTIGLLNSASAGSQPPSYTLVNNSADAVYQMTGSQLSDLSIVSGVDQLVEATSTWICNPYTNPSVPAVNPSTAHPIPAWNVAASIGGASVAVIENFQLDIKRNTAPIHTEGQQAPLYNFAGPI